MTKEKAMTKNKWRKGQKCGLICALRPQCDQHGAVHSVMTQHCEICGHAITSPYWERSSGRFADEVSKDCPGRERRNSNMKMDSNPRCGRCSDLEDAVKAAEIRTLRRPDAISRSGCAQRFDFTAHSPAYDDVRLASHIDPESMETLGNEVYMALNAARRGPLTEAEWGALVLKMVLLTHLQWKGKS